MSIRSVFGAACRDGRIGLDLTQDELAAVLEIHRGHLANIEAGRANISLELMERIGETLGQRLELIIHPPRFISVRSPHDTVHAWMSGYVGRRLATAQWQVEREADVSANRVRGWIDLLAYVPTSQTLVIIELKTTLDDLGGAERQIGWYERWAASAAGRLGWRPRRVIAWLVVLASEDVDRAVRRNRDAIDLAFPGRSSEMLQILEGSEPAARRSIAMVDPASRRARWLIPLRLDGRRTNAPYRDYADAAGRIRDRRR